MMPEGQSLSFFARDLERFAPFQLAIAALTLLFAALNGGLISFPGWIASDKLYRLTWLVAGMALLLFVPRIPVPALLRRALIPLAAASFSIYVVHGLPIHIINEHVDRSLDLTKIVLGTASGLVFHYAVSALAARIRSRRDLRQDALLAPEAH